MLSKSTRGNDDNGGARSFFMTLFWKACAGIIPTFTTVRSPQQEHFLTSKFSRVLAISSQL